MIEMFDVLDDQANKTGEKLSREEVHKKELWHGVVHVWILNSENKILMQFRGPDKKLSPNCWDSSVAGHVIAGETNVQAAIREVAEEVGIVVAEKELQEVGFISEQLPFLAGGIHREHEWVYILRRDLIISELILQQDEVKKVKWFSANELASMLKGPKRNELLSKHEDAIFNFAINEVKESH